MALFKSIPTEVGDLVKDVKIGKIGLPDLQRPFVWKDNKVRDLFDSMLKGYPIGYIMLWESPVEYEDKKANIGENRKIYDTPKELVIDGQQRLTALVAAMFNVKVKDKNFVDRNIKISYNPLAKKPTDERFAVWTSAYERDPEWISKISDVFIAKENNCMSTLRRQYIKNINESRVKKGKAILSDDEEDLIEDNINLLLKLSNYSLPTLSINYDADEEDVAEIFVRVNSGGQNLTESNFIQTLLSVYDNESSDKILKFSEQSRIPATSTSYNTLFTVEPTHLIRMAVGVGFHRARLRYAHMLLRGKNLDTGIVTEQERNTNLQKFKEAIEKTMNLNNWHNFLNIIGEAGYISDRLIISSNAVVFSYVLYLIGKYEYKLNSTDLRKSIRKWFFMSTITGFYTNSPETEMEKQFADLRSIKSSDEFIKYLDKIIQTNFTEDFFNVSLPNELNSAAVRSPAWNGYIASQIILNTPLLFSTVPISKYFIIGTSGTKNSIDKHHLFPKSYLESIGIEDNRDKNQIANFTYLDYTTNISISDTSPKEYTKKYKEILGQELYTEACKNNALPENWENMDYFAFLESRRNLMAKTIKKAYLELCK